MPPSLTAVIGSLHLWIPIAIVILASLVTGLSSYPKASGAVAILQRLVSLLSLVQHFDSPGSLKLPLALPAAPAVVGSPVKAASTSPRGSVVLIILVIIGVVALIGGAGAVVESGHAGSGLGKQIVDCTERAISAEATSAAPQVEGILGGNSPNWNQELVTLESAVGAGVLCDVEAVVSRLEHGPDGGMGELAPHDQVKLVRGRAFLEEMKPTRAAK